MVTKPAHTERDYLQLAERMIEMQERVEILERQLRERSATVHNQRVRIMSLRRLLKDKGIAY